MRASNGEGMLQIGNMKCSAQRVPQSPVWLAGPGSKLIPTPPNPCTGAYAKLIADESEGKPAAA